MKKIALLLITLIFVGLTACTSTTNPLSSEYEEDLGNDNGHRPQYSGESQNG